MAISDRAREITHEIYCAYGSGTGYLFGIEPDKRRAVEAIVQKVLDYEHDAREQAQPEAVRP